MDKKRLDALLAERGIAESREKAKALIMAGDVLVDGQVVDRPSAAVPAAASLSLRAQLPYVSRGGLKLEHALCRFGVDVSGAVVMDVGASTGGFTDCLLQRNIRRCYAIDVGYGQLAWQLRQDPRVTVLDRTNIRHLEYLPEQPYGAVIDVSFISLRLVLPKVAALIRQEGWIIALIKPQFEAGRGKVGKGGVVRDPTVHREVLAEVLGRAEAQGLTICDLTTSPIKGPAGNREYLAYFRRRASAASAPCVAPEQLEAKIEQTIAEAFSQKE